ncbi:phage tail assembly chaperone [Burkholderia gladioli]|uniref:phage tail assembly chaperone n=1 Tax=Burkholderia gladioli TaxID=28095 RepID=UPI001640B288|nr:phage tail assembly chaperone [Burkholderia gladioli]
MNSVTNILAAIRAAALDPLIGWKHEPVPVPEWGDAQVIVREPLQGDRGFWLEQLVAAAGVEPGDDEETRKAKFERVAPNLQLESQARLFVRVVFVQSDGGPARRAFGDDDVHAVAAVYGAVHDRLVAKAIELGNLAVDPIADGKNDSAETQVSV